MPSFNKFTLKAQEALQNAQDFAVQKNHGDLRALHLLLALLEDAQSLIGPILENLKIDITQLKNLVNEELNKSPKIFSGSNLGQLYISQEVIQILERAGKISKSQKDEFISCEHLLLGILDTPSTAQVILDNFGLRKDAAVRTMAKLRGSARITDETPETKYQVLDKY